MIVMKEKRNAGWLLLNIVVIDVKGIYSVMTLMPSQEELRCQQGQERGFID